ncbi:unnamed protein product [Allacma fusca]|uniref:Caveolin n=1 Tax=Allacma fusca TaxID=39272 RepID=A0A8J2KF26_9HEXA|nr:unnamed protein product [Allacma fusca]
MSLGSRNMSLHLNKVSSSVTHPSDLGANRDPQDLNKSVQVVWNSVIGEPDNVRSPDWVWRVSNIIYSTVQGWTYKILTVITAPIFAFIIGFHFALLIFLQIWVFRPILKFLHIIFSLLRTLGEIVLNGLCGPIFETIGLCMSNARIRHQRVYDAKDEPQFPFII